MESPQNYNGYYLVSKVIPSDSVPAIAWVLEVDGIISLLLLAVEPL